MDLLNLEPTKVSKDLKSKIIFFYGDVKSGKTTTASKFPKALIAATEIGTNALNNVFVQPIQKWGDMNRLLKELKKEPVQEKFETIVIDTADNLYDLAEEYVLSQHGVSKIGDIPFGAGYKETEKIFDKALRQIPMLGYGLVIISHATERVLTNEQGEAYSKIQPTLPKAPQKVANRMSDIVGYSTTIKNEDGQDETRLIIRGTERVMACSRWKHTPSSIVSNYDNLVNAIHDAVEKSPDEDGVQALDEQINHYEKEEKRDFEEAREELISIAQAFVDSDRLVEFNTAMYDSFDDDLKISDLTAKNQEAVEVLIEELKEKLEQESLNIN